MPKTKLLSLLSNIAILANLVVGFLQIHWLVIAVFIIIHAFLRLAYLNAQNAIATQTDTTETHIAPPMIRHIASVITAVILALLVYGLGYGVAYLLNHLS